MNNKEKEYEFLMRLIEKREKPIEKKLAMDFIKEHNHIRYCEAIIDKNGLIAYVNPSHQKTLIKETGIPEEEIWNMIPYSANPIEWLINKTGCICVWYNYILAPKEITSAQKRTLKLLIKHKKIDLQGAINERGF